MSTLRFRAVEEAFKKKAIKVTPPAECTSAYYGKYVFNEVAMKKYLSTETLKVLQNSVEHGETLDRSIADEVATAMKQWAMELGATHYSHWFQPLTGGTAEKHDSFIEYKNEIGGDVIEKFTGKLLVQAEPDASSFPNGGIRSTFEARGYTAWDPSSPAFVIDDTLCIPTIFISYTGDALDYKAPLLKSIAAINRAATDVCAAYFDSNVKNVKTYLGWEQEYFLVDEGLFATRPDLLMTGRTLLGHESPKNQQLEDHYFGSIPQRVVAFMRELEFEVYKYGIPLKTRHNEVAPNQFELAPIFNEANLSVDQNLLVMSLMKRIARRHGFRVLLHERRIRTAERTIAQNVKEKSMSKMTDIRFRLQIAGGNMRMIKRDVFEYFKKEPDVMQVKDVVRLLHCSKNTVYKLIHEGRIDSIKIGRNILIPKTALVEMMVNERYYQIIFPYNPDSLWTMKERSRIIASNKKSTQKEA